MCFHIDSKSVQAAKCDKSIIIPKVINCALCIGKFEQKCVMLKGELQSPHIKYHIKTIGIDQSLSNSDIFEHRCLQNMINYINLLGSVKTNNN